MDYLVTANGQEFDLPITAKNNGTKTAPNTRLVFQIPAGITVTSFSPSIGAWNASSRIYSVGDLTAGDSIAETMRVMAQDVSKLPLLLKYTIYQDGTEVDLTNNSKSFYFTSGVIGESCQDCNPEPAGAALDILYSGEVGSVCSSAIKCTAGKTKYVIIGSYVNIDEANVIWNEVTGKYYLPLIDKNQNGSVKWGVKCIDGTDEYGPYPASGATLVVKATAEALSGPKVVAVTTQLVLADKYVHIDGSANDLNVIVPESTVNDPVPVNHKIQFLTIADPGVHVVKITGAVGVSFWGYGTEIPINNFPQSGYLIHEGSNVWSVF